MKKSRKTYCRVSAHVESANGPTREWLWAIRVTKDTAKIDSIPFCTDAVALNDLVQVGDFGEVLDVLERTTRTVRAMYVSADDRKTAMREWKAIRNHFEKHGIECESARAGFFAVAVPHDMTEEQLSIICDECPVPLTKLKAG